MIPVGITRTKELVVTEATTAKAVGSGGLEVFATPSMIALMEGASMECVAPYLEEGEGTVGTAINVQHTAATPVGMRVSCTVELTQVDRRKLTFAITAQDETGPIGSATHERFIVDNARFMEKAQHKLRSDR